MAELEDIGSDMEEEYNFRKRVDEGLIKVRPPRDEDEDEEDEDSFEKEDNQNLNPGNNKGDAEDGNENLKRKEDKEISTSTSSDTEEEPVKCPICKSEYAPLQKDRKNRRIGCDGCGEWYHFVCAGISKNNIPGKNENWYCRQCSRKNAGSAEWKPSTSEEKKLKIPSLRKQNSGPSQTAIDDCRSHLAECLRQNRMEEFPTRQRTQIGEPVEFNIFIDDDIIHNKEEDEKRKAAMMEREKRQQLINLI